jgi:hypothetical protein
MVVQREEPSNFDRSESQDGSSCDGEHVHHGANHAEPESTIAKRETRDVFRLRLAVLLVLVSSALVVALSVYFYLSHSEDEQFLRQFDDNANKVLDAVGSSLDQAMAAFDGVAVNLVSTARVAKQSWPFVTTADFAVRLAKALPLSHAIVIYSYHVVSSDQRDQWEEYVELNITY